MTAALTVDVIRIFTAFAVVAAIVTIALVLATQTPAADDSDSGEDGWPRVPDEQMRRIDAALPKAQAWDRWVKYREAEKQ